jgi:hypothetical protein
MCHAMHEPLVGLAPELAGHWVAWERDGSEIVATGATFDEVKRNAAAVGKRSLWLARMPAGSAAVLQAAPWVYAVAVFVSQVT